MMTRGWRLSVTRWVDRGTPGEDPDVWAQIGAALADLHSLPPVERQFAIPVDAACHELTAHPEWPTDLVSEVVRLVRGMAQAPLAVVHGQPSPADVVQKPDGSVALLDWDESGTGPAVLDVGYPLICVFLTEEKHWHEQLARAFFRSYQETASAGLPPVRDIFSAALLHGMRSAMFANHSARLRRVGYALDAEDQLIAALAR